MPEWSIGPVSKSGDCHRSEGSNPSLSLKKVESLVGSTFFIGQRLEPSERVRLTADEPLSFLPFETTSLISTFGPESIKGSNRLQVYERECASGLFKVQPGNRHKNQSIVRHGPQMKFTGPEGAS